VTTELDLIIENETIVDGHELDAQAPRNVYVAGNVIASPNSVLTLTAGKKINLGSNTRIYKGAHFHARVTTPPPSAVYVAAMVVLI
jgi:hypothetical protein